MLGRHYLLAVAAQGMQALVGVLLVVALARILQPVDYGTFVLAAAAVAIAAVVVAAGPQAAVLILSGRSPEQRPFVAGASVVLGTATLIAVPVAWFAVSTNGGLSGIQPAVVILAAARIAPTIYAGLVTAGLSGAGRIRDMLSLNVAGAIFALAAAAGALLSADALDGAMRGAAIGSWSWAFAAFVLAWRTLGLRPPSEKRLWRDLFTLALPLHLGTVCYWLMLRADAFAVGVLIGGPAVGQYGLALTLSERVSYLTTPLYNVSAWRLSGRDRHDATATLLRVTRIEIVIGAGAAVVGLVFSGWIVSLMAGEAYAPAALPLALLIVGAAALPIWASAGLFLVSQLGGAWLTAKLQALVAAITLAGYLVIIPSAGLVGAATVSTSAYLALAISGLVLVHRGQPYPLRALVPGPADARAAGAVFRSLTHGRVGPDADDAGPSHPSPSA